MDFKLLTTQIRSADDFFKEKISRTIDRHLTIRNWLIGFYIVEYEQNGQDRATYGSKLLTTLAAQLNLKGLSSPELSRCRQLYNVYPQILGTVSQEFKEKDQLEILGTVSQRSEQLTALPFSGSQSSSYKVDIEKIISNLSFSHLVELIKIDSSIKRTYYEVEAIKGVWSVRELKRQINSLNFERSAAAKDPKLMVTSLSKQSERLTPDQIIKTPYVFDFLGLPDGILGSESTLEAALIDDLKNFILELGHGFCFEAQQKRIVIGGEYFFIDLVFYHRLLKCHVIIELKVDEFTHANAGQLNTYIQYYKENILQDDDNPPIGILLCTHQNKELVHYALGGMDENLFVSQYKTILPSTEELEKFLQEEKKKL